MTSTSSAPRNVPSPPTNPILILGAGINGCALARELLLNELPVWIVDIADVASGATAYSSRLIHGGLRYLEYGEFDLVRESLAERTRLLKLAPQFVHPLELFIPAKSRFGGLIGAVGRFLGWRWWPIASRPPKDRGVAVIRAGLRFYDEYARDPTLPRHRLYPVGSRSAVPVNPDRYRWLCSYHDAQVVYPERLTLALLEDARQLSASNGRELRVFTYHQAIRYGNRIAIRHRAKPDQEGEVVEPAAIINATGAWVDQTLDRLQVPSPRLMGGTKGSHFFTYHPELRSALGGRGIYAEAKDGRPIFIIPLADAVLIGTTDEPFDNSPEHAVASGRELKYLMESANEVLRPLQLTDRDIAFHYSGVRPLPYVDESVPAAVTRRHWLEKNAAMAVPFYSIIGGKLTTCRSLAEEAVRTLLQDLNLPTRASSQSRVFPGGEQYPPDYAALQSVWAALAQDFGLGIESIRAVWALCGTRTKSILTEMEQPAPALLPDTPLPREFVRWVIRNEWVSTIGDLVERRLMLLYHQRLTRSCLWALAELLVAEGKLAPESIGDQVNGIIERLRTHFGKQVQQA